MLRMPTLVALLLVLLVAGTTAAEVDVEFNAALDFDAYATYSWHDGTPARRADGEKRIRAAVERELLAAGLRQVDEGADLWVATHLLVDRHTLDDLKDRIYFEFYTGVRDVDAFDLEAGTLVVDLIDSSLERVVWRGAASETIRGGVDENLKKIDKVVHKMFKRLPRPAR